MKKELHSAAQRMLGRAQALGLRTKDGNALVVDLMEELVAAMHGFRNIHAYKASLATEAEPPALEQEFPAEAGNDYRLVSGKGFWVKMGQFVIHPYLMADGITVDVHPLNNSGTTFESVFVENYLQLRTAEELGDRLNPGDDSSMTLETVTHDGQAYDLRVCGVGSAAYFEWINEGSDPIGDVFYERTESTSKEFLERLNAAPITIYCIALEGDVETGVDWFYKEADRDAALTTTGAEIEVPFQMPVPRNSTSEEITNLADTAAWNKTYHS